MGRLVRSTCKIEELLIYVLLCRVHGTIDQA
jgi:hypothetical protein